MYLLKLSGVIYIHKVKKFTFHHVSIKTDVLKAKYRELFNSHSTMYLLKPKTLALQLGAYIHSHSTMYLLKLLSTEKIDL